MPIMLHPRWQYIYWILAFWLCVFLVKIRGYFAQEVVSITVVTFVIILGFSFILTYINNQIHWGMWNIINSENNEWECLECGETSIYLSNLANLQHRFMYTCKGDEECLGCGQKVYQCDGDKAKHSQIRRSAPYPNGELYRICVRERENCRRTCL